MIIHLLSLLALAAVSHCSLVAHLAECSTHNYSEEVSKQLASSIKIRLYLPLHVEFRKLRKSAIKRFPRPSLLTSFRKTIANGI